jgi:RNA polymerase sigma-70 factor (ECF subfamily)
VRLGAVEIRRAAQGDRACREQLVRELGPLVLALCRRLSVEPDDDFQAVWEKVFRSLPRFDPSGPAKLSTWVAALTHHHLLDRQRAAAVRARADLQDLLALPREEGPAEREARLELALASLPEELRRIVVAHHLGGLPLSELASQEELPVGTLKSRLHRARALLATALREEEA